MNFTFNSVVPAALAAVFTLTGKTSVCGGAYGQDAGYGRIAATRSEIAFFSFGPGLASSSERWTRVSERRLRC